MVIYKYLILLFVSICLQYVQPIEISGSTKLDLKEGSICVTKDTARNMTGTCITLFKCRSAGQASIDTKAGYDHNWPPVFVCSYKENADPIVCCSDCLLDNKETLKGKVAMEHGNLYSDEGPKAWKKCIEYYSTLPYRSRRRVQWNNPFWDSKKECIEFGIKAREYGYGGYLAKPAEFPHMALLGFGAERDSAQWLCGGSIISEKYILSAAHCASAAKLGNVSFAALGILKRTDLKDYWRIYKIKTIIQHPEYNPPSKYHDIMLLETANEINFGKFVLPACLDTGKGENHTLSATGWGRQGARGALDNDLQVMQLHRYNDSLCSELFPPHRLFTSGYNATIQMCYGREDKIVDTCEGDSGGPLQYTFVDGYHHILGITSFGKDCGIPGNAGMYTRVRYYVPWIESIVWKDE